MNPIERLAAGVRAHSMRAIGRAMSLVENGTEEGEQLLKILGASCGADPMVIGITGPPGVGKSTLTNCLIEFYRAKSRRLGIVAVDPSSPISGGALLGDRIRMMRSTTSEDVVMRSMASRGRLGGLASATGAVIRLLAYSDCDPIIVETVGVGQSELDVIEASDVAVLVLAPGLGDDIQAMKSGLMEMTDIIVVNKADRADAEVTTLELEQVAREKGRQVIQTVSTTGHGIALLGEAIAAADERSKRSGRRATRRRRALESEVLECALGIVRPQLKKRLQDWDMAGGATPRDIARRLVQEFKTEV